MYTMTVDGLKLYDPTVTEYALESPKLDLEANRFGTLSFVIYKTNPRYGSIQNMKSMIRLYRDNQIMMIFRPVASKLTFRGGIEYKCEELLACLNDVMRRPKAFIGTARQLIQECLSDAATVSGDGEIYRPSVVYFRSILDENLEFRYLTGDSPIGWTPYESTAQGDGRNIWADKYTVLETKGGEPRYPTDYNGDVQDLLNSLAALGYMGRTYVPDTKWYPHEAVARFLAAHGIEIWTNQQDCVHNSIWQSLKKVGAFDILLAEMQDFIRDLPETDADWDEQETGFPVNFVLGDTPASDTLDNLDDDAQDRTELDFGENDYIGYWDYLQDNLIEPYGGYLVSSWSENSCTLHYYRDTDLPISSQQITFGDNMVDMYIDSDCDAAYSTVIPLGKDGITIETVAPNERDFLTDGEAYALYGRREIVKEWPEIETASKLYQAAMNWMLTRSLKLKDEITVSAYDLKYAGVDVSYLNFMENVPIVNALHGIDDMLPVKAMSISLDRPTANKYGLSNEPESVFDEDKKKSSLTDKVSKSQKQIRTIGGHNALLPQG